MVARPPNGTLVVLLLGVAGCLRGGFDFSVSSSNEAGVPITVTSTGGNSLDGPSIDGTAVGGASPFDVSIWDGTATGGVDSGNPSTSDASIAGSTGTSNGGAAGGTSTGGATGETSTGGSSSVGTSSGGGATGGTTPSGTATGGAASGDAATDGADAFTDDADGSTGGADGSTDGTDVATDGDSSADTIAAGDTDGVDVDAAALGDCLSSTYGTHTYVFCNEKVDWVTARDNCASIGTHLVRVDDPGENQYLYDSMYATNPIQGIWIGANDLAVEGEWRWADGSPDGTLFWLGDFTGSPQNELYNAWFPIKQPSAQAPQKDCAVLDAAKEVGWYDHDCAMVLEYACEFP